jgi:hypothetical protein
VGGGQMCDHRNWQIERIGSGSLSAITCSSAWLSIQSTGSRNCCLGTSSRSFLRSDSRPEGAIVRDKNMNPSLSRIILGYLSAVTTAALCHATWWTLAEMAQNHLGDRAPQAALEMFIAGWVFALFMALIPFCLGLSLESRFQIDNPLFFVAGGALTAAVLVLPRVYFLGGGVFDQSDASLLERCWDDLPRFAISGTAAGCMYYLVRKIPAVRDSFGRETPDSRSGPKAGRRSGRSGNQTPLSAKSRLSHFRMAS